MIDDMYLGRHSIEERYIFGKRGSNHKLPTLINRVIQAFNRTK